MSKNLVRERLIVEFEAFKNMGHIDPLKALIIKRGCNFKSQPFIGKRGKAKECFSNALHYAIENNLFYCEGYGLSGKLVAGGLLLPMEHAWACDDDFKVYDPTWEDTENSHYFGLRFTHKEAAKRCLQKGTYGMFYGRSVIYDIKYLEQLEEKLAA